MRIVYTSDLHGHESLYRAFFEFAEAERADVWIIGGDLSPRPSGEATGLAEQRRFFRKDLAPWLAAERRRQPARRGYLMLGNDDWAATADCLEELAEAGLATLLHDRVVALGDGFQIAGYSYVPITPFPIKDWEKFDDSAGDRGAASRTTGWLSAGESFRPVDLAELRPAAKTSLEADLAKLAERSDPTRTVYVIHTPPFGTRLDVLHDRSHVGSQAVARFIRERQPYLTLHGHIHESPRLSGAYFDQLGATVAVNPGQSVGPDSVGSLRAVVFDLADPAATIRHTRIPR